MEEYDADLVPPPYPQNNTGTTCYLNALLAMLVSLPSFTRAAVMNPAYLDRTDTGRALRQYVAAYAYREGGDGTPRAYLSPAGDIALQSTRVLGALSRDLAQRHRLRFGGGQECASEALVKLLDMLEPPPAEPEKASPEASFEASVQSPITRLFLHRFRYSMHCRECRQAVSKMTDHAIAFNMFHIDEEGKRPTTPEEFSKALRARAAIVDAYRCEKCGAQARAVRADHLTMVPEIIICTFNLFYSETRRVRYFPEEFTIPAAPIGSGEHVFRLVAQIEQSGTRHAGHYWARALRADGQVYLLNDTSVTLSRFAPTPYTYMIAYHYVGLR